MLTLIIIVAEGQTTIHRILIYLALDPILAGSRCLYLIPDVRVRAVHGFLSLLTNDISLTQGVILFVVVEFIVCRGVVVGFKAQLKI